LDVSHFVVPGPAQRHHRMVERQRRPSYQPSPTGWALGRPSAKALKARSIGLAIEVWVNVLPAGCVLSILRSTISQNESRSWRLRLCLGLLPGAFPQADVRRAFGPRRSAKEGPHRLTWKAIASTVQQSYTARCVHDYSDQNFDGLIPAPQHECYRRHCAIQV
jgi:hypothetical protein